MIMTNDEKYEQIKQLTDARMKAMRGIQRMNRKSKKEMNRIIKDINTPPTQNQIKYAEHLAEVYDVDLSEIPFTKKDYSEFISTFKDM